MLKVVRSALAFVLATGAAQAWSAPVCAPTEPRTRAELYPASDPYVDMPVAELEPLAAQNQPRALNALGVVYGTGRGVKKDSKKSFEFYRRAAELGLPTAQANLAFMYLNGEGVEKDAALAYSWASKATAVGHMRGQVMVGYMLGMGEGVKMDRREAAFCYLLAARQGHGEAQETMATIYREGLGIPADQQEAAAWEERARRARNSGSVSWYDETPLTEMPAAWNAKK